MAKYSVNGVEVIGDDGLIDWARLENKPAGLVTGINTTSRIVDTGTGGLTQIITVTGGFVEDDGAGSIRSVVQRTITVCDCACDCG